jgi:hypothetical protein
MDDENKQHKKNGERLRPYTISGLCNFLDIHMDTWCEYAKKSEFSDSIKKAKKFVEQYVEEGLLNGSLNAIGAIFNLKNNFGWVDKIEVNTNTGNEQLTSEEIESKIRELKRKSKKLASVDTADVEGNQ